MRTARIRTFLRGHTPTFLYDRGLVIGKVEDCGHHVWYVEGRDLDEGLVYSCYHCERQSTVPFRRGRAGEDIGPPR